MFCKVDVTSEEQVDAGFAKARAAIGQERVLVNCAGTGNAIKTASRDKTTGAIVSFPTAEFDRIIQINLVGTFRCTAKSAAGMMTLPVLDDGERGAIVNTASVAAQDGQIGQASYSASKAGIVGMTLPIARDLMGEGIRVNTILPGIFDTPLLARLPEHVKSALAASVPFPKRLGHPDEYAALAEFMITTGYLNGESRAAGWRYPHGAALKERHHHFWPDRGFKSRLRDRDSETIAAIELLLKRFAGPRNHHYLQLWGLVA